MKSFYCLLLTCWLLPAIVLAGGDPVEYEDYTMGIKKLLTESTARPDAVRLHELFDLAWNIRLAEYPESASMDGYEQYAGQWTDLSFSAIERRRKYPEQQLAVLETIDRAKLSVADQLNYDLFRHDLEDDLAANEFPSELMPINQMGGAHQRGANTLAYMPTSTIADCENILARLRSYPELMTQTIALLDSGLQAGITPPRVVMRDVPRQVLDQISEDPADAPILAVLNEKPESISDTMWSRITNDAYKTYREAIRPALQELHQYLTETYIPGCVETVGRSKLPHGREWYRWAVRHFTTTDLTPDEVFELGQREVARIRAEMEKIIRDVGFEGDFAAFSEFLRTDPQFYFTEADALVAAYRDICKRIDPELVRLFGVLPRLPYGVLPVPAYAEKSQTTAYYQPGSPKAARPGYYYANTYDLASRPIWEMEALTLHEAVPGHHLQIALAQELENVPEFRRNGWITAYGEGWALYAESLGEELGLYEDPYAKFGQLTYEMWRAIRLVVDVGMHWKGWTRQEAIDFFKANSSKTEHDIVVEIDRYIVWPGQALAYKMGELKIKKLRARAEKRLAERFDIRSFHDEILGAGGLPLSLLDKRMQAWEKRQLARE